jgi:hypothetical protein
MARCLGLLLTSVPRFPGPPHVDVGAGNAARGTPHAGGPRRRDGGGPALVDNQTQPIQRHHFSP